MASNWIPPDIGSICQEQHAQLTQCSQTGFMFLALLAQLFGRSSDQSYSKTNPYSNFSPHFSNQVNGLGSLTPSVGTSGLGDISGVPLGPVKLSQEIESSGPKLGPVLPVQKTSVFSHGSEGSRGYSEMSFYHKPEKPELKFGFEESQEPFSKFSQNSNPIFDYNFINQKHYFDIDTANSQKVSVKTEKKSRKRKKRQAVEEYDFIIVGAGSAGCVLANRLSEVKKWKVLLLEAGPEEPDVTSVPAFAPALGRSSIDWMYRTQPEKLTCRAQRGQTCAWFRGKTMGGSSAINYMVYMRGNRRDYDSWAELGNHGWSFREVLPYFKKSENNQDIESHDKYYHSIGGPLNVERFPYIDVNTMMLVQAFREKGLPITDFNGQNQIGTDIGQSTSINGRRLSTNAAFIRPIRNKRPNLSIINEAYVTKVNIDPITKRAYGIQYLRNGIHNTVYARKEVIVSAGAINSPKLLMLSGIGPDHHLRSLDIPVLSDLNVGYNLQDHVTTDGLIISLSNKTSTAVNEHQLIDEIYDYYRQPEKKRGPLSGSSTLSGIAFIRTEFADFDVPDIQFHFDGRNVRDYYSDPPTYMATNIFPLAFYDGLAARPLLLAPKSRGYILLNVTDPVFGPPLIYSGFFTDRKDLDTLIAGCRYVISLEHTEAFRASGAGFVKIPLPACINHPWGTNEYFACILMHYTSTIYHPAGTCKMGPQWDKDAVVDSRLRVYGIKNLRVVDASIMPLIIRGNLNAPTIMIAEKASDIIKEEWL